MKITICGSARFPAEIDEAVRELSLQGHLVYSLTPGIVTSIEMRAHVDQLHRAKIDASDAIYVVAPDGYVGHHTRHEIEYARANGKIVLPAKPEQETDDEPHDPSCDCSLYECKIEGCTRKADMCLSRSKAALAHPEQKSAPASVGVLRDWLVFSNQNRAWWRANSSGYTTDIRGAGRYTRDEAISISATSRDGWRDPGDLPCEMAIPIDALPEKIRAALSESTP